MVDYYFDTSILIDIYDERGQNGEYAKKLIEKIILEGDFVIFSDVLLFELKKLNFSIQEITHIFSIARPDNLKKVSSDKNQIILANKLAKQRDVPLRDALHAILARDNCATLISRDWDFKKLRDITEAKKPEDLI